VIIKAMKKIRLTLLAALSLTACTNDANTNTQEDISKVPAFASTYSPQASETTLITNAHIIDGTGQEIENANLLITDGKSLLMPTEMAMK